MAASCFENGANRGPLFGLLASSALFGVVHPHHMLSATAFGVIMALLYTRTQSLWPSILVHMLHNAIITLVQWSGERVTKSSAVDMLGEIQAAPGTVAGLLAAGLPPLLCYVWLNRSTLGAQLPPFAESDPTRSREAMGRRAAIRGEQSD